ncbi:unnamed protein product [Allacma fusca]|uniref:Bestrophin homolog n=1 Tax=Allacma fusca TaxID=39272 RepID=A0A8J2LKZ8_9HEXA|nr:unnamed protein product [Allacma fusca]
MNNKTKHPKYWAPIVWTGGILSRARREGRCSDDMSMNEIITQLTKYRSGLGDLLGFDWATIPLMYTQVVTLATYLYFMAALIGKQFINIDDQKIDLYVPFFTLVEFFFYVGWLKVAETLVNPFGEDDDDFEVNWLIDRNLQVSYLIVDEMHAEHPPMLKDAYWDETGPIDLPYTEAAIKYKTDGHAGSANYMATDKAEFVYLDDRDDITAIKGARSNLVTRRQSLIAPVEMKHKRFTADGEFVKN